MADNANWFFLRFPKSKKSSESFITQIGYQDNNNEYRYYEITAIKRGGKYTIIFFLDKTFQIKYEQLLEDKKSVDLKCQLLDEDIKSLESIKQKAQSQALKMALINKISNIMRESIDLSSIIVPTLKELSIIFGAFRTYYAEYNIHNNIFKITQTLDEVILLEVKAKDGRTKAASEVLNNKDKYKDVKKLIRLKDSNLGSINNIDTFPSYMSFLL